MTIDTNQELQFLRRDQVSAMTGIASSTLYKMVAEDRFPKPFTIGQRSVAWEKQTILAWMNEKMGAQS